LNQENYTALWDFIPCSNTEVSFKAAVKALAADGLVILPEKKTMAQEWRYAAKPRPEDKLERLQRSSTKYGHI
jgi:hypothetical protein